MKMLIVLVLIGFGVCMQAQTYIADYTVAKEEVLRNIPKEYIDKARNEFKIAYQHTSHGTHVSRGLFGLQEYKSGDDVLFGVTINRPIEEKLEFHDYALSSYGTSAWDLSVNETAFIQATRNFLGDEANSEINVVMWAWCNIANHDVEGNYLPGMQTLIDEYGEGGVKIGTGQGMREIPVQFIFMTGHANVGNNIGEGKPKNQADLINQYCETNGYFCLDYYSIDTHCMNDNYWDDAGDDGQSAAYGGNFYSDFQDKNTISEHYYENKETPFGTINFGEHNTQHITANRKAFAMWWILARMAGYNGVTTSETEISTEKENTFYFNSNIRELVMNGAEDLNSICIYNMCGQIVLKKKLQENKIRLQQLNKGVYIVVVGDGINSEKKKVVLN